MPSRRRIIGLAGAALWLIVASAGFLLLSLWLIGTSQARQAMLIAGAIAAPLIGINIGVIRAVVRLPGGLPARTQEEQATFRAFVRVGIAEVAAFMAVNPVFVATHHVELVVPLDVAIVGAHFLPLARIFKVPRYYLLGGLFCGVAVLTLLLFSKDASIGHAAAWYVVPSFGCAPVACLIAAANLREAWRFVRQSRPLAAAV